MLPPSAFKPKFSPERFEQIKRIFAAMEPPVVMTYDRGFWFESKWSNGMRWRKKFVSHGSRYPLTRFSWGGTTDLILCQLIRYAQQLPTCTFRSWDHWVSVGITPKARDIAREIGWPEAVPCVMCCRMIETGDWYDWRGAGINCHGLGCWHSDKGGCRGKNPKEQVK